MITRFLLFFLIFFTPLCSTSIDDYLCKAQYHAILKDYSAACETICQALFEHPQVKILHRELIITYANACLEKEAIGAWKAYICRFGEDWDDTHLFEKLSWCILQQGISNPAPLTRLVALSGACSTRNMRSHQYIIKALSDPCALIRSAACQACAQLRKTDLSCHLLCLAERDKSVLVRIAAIEALAQLKDDKIKQLIIQKLKQGDICGEERLIMAKAMAILEEKTPFEFFKKLANSSNSIFRIIAAEYAIYTRLPETSPILINLLNDPKVDVQIAALQSLAILWPEWSVNGQILENLRNKSHALDGMLAVSASWLLSLCAPQEGLNALEKHLSHVKSPVRSYAIGAICATGNLGIPLLKKILKNSKENDACITLNAAVGLLRLREDIAVASTAVEDFLETHKDRLSLKSWGAISSIIEGRAEQSDALSQELLDLKTRLEIINLLAIVKSSKVEHLLACYLESRAWGASGIASMLLLTEGDDSALELVENISQQAQTQNLKLQAALVKAMWGKDADSLIPLYQIYPTASKETKEKILGALALVGEKKSISFLVGALEEPAASLRVQAASTLLEVIYK